MFRRKDAFKEFHVLLVCNSVPTYQLAFLLNKFNMPFNLIPPIVFLIV